jgi:hypothetical protein
MDSDFFLWGNAALKYIIGNRLTSTYWLALTGRTDLGSDKGQLPDNPDRKWTVEVGPKAW